MTENSFEPAESSLRFIPPLRSYTSCLGGTQDNMQRTRPSPLGKIVVRGFTCISAYTTTHLAMLGKVLAANCLFRSLLITKRSAFGITVYSPDDIDASNLPYLSAYRCNLIRHVVESAKVDGCLLISKPMFTGLAQPRMGLLPCARCRTIPLDLFLEQDFFHELYPSITALKSSTDAGCHTCLIFLKSFYSPPGPPVEGDSSGPVLLR